MTMCLLTYYPENVDPDTDALHNGALLNRDGYGYAIVARDRVIVGKGMDATKMIDQFADVRKQHRGHALFHSRMATDGAYDTNNCHPFFVGNDPRTVVGHNGIIPQCRPFKGDKRSDTAIFAQHHLPQRNLNRERGRNRLAKWLGNGNKIVVLTVDPAYEHSAYIINESLGQWDNGIWYSNDGYKAYRSAWGPAWRKDLPHRVPCSCFRCDGRVPGADDVDWTWARYVCHLLSRLAELDPSVNDSILETYDVWKHFTREEMEDWARELRGTIDQFDANTTMRAIESTTGGGTAALFCYACDSFDAPTPIGSCRNCDACLECGNDIETVCDCWFTAANR